MMAAEGDVLGRCHLISMPRIIDPRGSLTFFESGIHIPFDIARIYYLYQVPLHANRGGHAHKALEQLIVAIHGGFSITLSDGRREASFQLDRPDVGLYICPMIWRTIDFKVEDAVCLVAASARYDEEDYIRDRQSFDRMAVHGPAAT